MITLISNRKVYIIRTKSFDKMKTPELLWLTVFLILDLVSTFDGFVTHYLFGHWTLDLNPFVLYLVGFVAPWTLVFFFIGSFGLCVFINEIIKRKYPEKHVYFRGFLLFFVLFELIAVINNYFVATDVIIK